jgi:hypothetical protein
MRAGASHRPVSVWLAAWGLALAGVATALAGVGVSWLSTIAAPADPVPALLGLAAGAACLVASTWTWTGRHGPVGVLVLAAIVPALLLVASASSSDAAGVFLLAVPAWFALLLALLLPSTRRWFARPRATAGQPRP